MDNVLHTILKKLDIIESRLKTVETTPSTSPARMQKPEVRVTKDELADRAWDIISKNEKEELSADFLAKGLGIDVKRAEKIFDQLESAGYGSCSWREA